MNNFSFPAFEQKTGFDLVRNAVVNLCCTPEGVDLATTMAFSDDADVIHRRLAATAEMLSIVASDEDLPVNRVRAIGRAVEAVRLPGSVLSVRELAALRDALKAMYEIMSYFKKRVPYHPDPHPLPLLNSMAQQLTEFPEIMANIDRIVAPDGARVRSQASAQLAEIRRELTRYQRSIGDIMRRVIDSGIASGYLDRDTQPTLRDGRLLIPVQPQFRRKINGIIHDESASGKTVFIEPAEIVGANNRLRSLELDEQREIARILAFMADVIRSEINSLAQCADTLGELDFIHAKALYAKQVDARLPNLGSDPELEWYHATHPVLLQALRRQGKQVVPLDVTLSQQDRILVISGPNAGGKSVCIKTVAIVQYMAQCGMLPPLYENSHVGVFSHIMIDIGDDQSLEDDLSTYSSHLSNMKQMLREGSPRSLFIIDEMGSGTEPQIGGAIAQATLAAFNDKQMWGVVTTHYQNLKTFAAETPGLVNGSMLYDRQQMRPLFRLSIGSPGSSFALEIARKIGLPAQILDAAEQIVGSDYVNLDRYLLDITRDKRYWERKRESIRQKEKKIDAVLERYEETADELRRHRREIIDDAHREAQRILADSNASIERTIHDIRRAQAEKEATKQARQRFEQERSRLTGSDPADTTTDHPMLKTTPQRRRAQPRPAGANRSTAAVRDFTPGDVVKMEGQSTPGRVIEVDGKNAVVAFGMLKTTVEISRLRHSDAIIHSGARSGMASDGGASRRRQLEFSRDIDLRGMHIDEALQAVTYFIDDAVQFGADRVRILHGTGTGALRQAIRQYLATVPAVVQAADEDVRLGGAGITVVDLAR